MQLHIVTPYLLPHWDLEKAAQGLNALRTDLLFTALVDELIITLAQLLERYERMVCKVWVQPSDCPKCGATPDMGYAQVSSGMA